MSACAPVQGDGKYRRLAVIGHGGMADVHLAVAYGPAAFHKLVVLKELRPGLASDPELRAMFLHEARIAACMAHPNIVQTHEVGGADRRPFIAMEFLDGQPLHRVLRRVLQATGKPLALAMHLRILVELLRGLEHAHTLRDYAGNPLAVVHRDVTPHNVIITHDGQVKLIDFGIAHTADGLGDTHVGTFKGKASYSAPEQAHGTEIDCRTDLFAVGVMLWEALCNRRMWPGLDEVAIVARLRAGDVPALEDGPYPQLRALCRQTLAVDPSVRPPTAAALAAAIEQDSPVVLASRRELAGILDTHFANERAELRARIAAQMRRPQHADADALIIDMSLVGGSDSHDSAAPPDEPTRPDGLHPARATRPAPETVARAEATESSPGHHHVRRRPMRAILLGGAVAVVAGIVALTTIPLTPTAPLDNLSAGPSAGTCAGDDAPEVELSGEIEHDAHLGCHQRYRLSFVTYVRPGVTLTIDPGTTIVGDAATRGTLVIQPGARLIAAGTPDQPIVFTSAAAPGQRRPGDWGGVLLLGRAPTNLRDASGQPTQGLVEGLANGGEYGGDDPDDDSGVLRFVRIEYSGVALAPNNEINGLTLAGVGRGTQIDHVQVRHAADDCFEFFGGTVDAHHLICHDPGDDGFDWDLGYTGRLQFLVVHDRDGRGGHGLEGDNDANGSQRTPISAPQLYNVTLCGRAADRNAAPRLGLLLRNASMAELGNLVVADFNAAITVRDPGTALRLRGALGFDLADGVGTDLPDLIAALQPGPSSANPCTDPGMAPALAFTTGAVLPPQDGFFDRSAQFLGAVANADDAWTTAAWTRWD